MAEWALKQRVPAAVEQRPPTATVEDVSERRTSRRRTPATSSLTIMSPPATLGDRVSWTPLARDDRAAIHCQGTAPALRRLNRTLARAMRPFGPLRTAAA
jgi:hypothetical protein